MLKLVGDLGPFGITGGDEAGGAVVAEAFAGEDLLGVLFVFEEEDAGFGDGVEVLGVGGEAADVDVDVAGFVDDAGGVAGVGNAVGADGAEDDAVEVVGEGAVGLGGGFKF